MKNEKKEYRYFSVPEWEKEQEYLREQHRNGWKFVKVTGLGVYHFEKCEPEDVVYQLDYNQEGIEHKKEYVQMFEDCGWEYLMDFFGYSYFRKPVAKMREDETIFCDEDSRIDMIKRVFAGRVVPLVVIFLCCIIPQLFIQHHMETLVGKILFGMFSVIFVLYLIIFINFGIRFWKLLHKH
ncbi:MAG: DUF2812 domain-containing protein [Roseburia sp.]